MKSASSAAAMSDPPRRVLLKVSGEALQGGLSTGLDPAAVRGIASQLVQCARAGSQVAVVVGGGNIVRGRVAAAAGMTRMTADYAGMLGTIINGLAMQDAIEAEGLQVRTMSAINVPTVAEPYIPRRARRHLEKGRIVLLVAGTGQPFVTTDTAAAQFGVAIGARRLLMGKRGTDGVYTADPATHAAAQRYESLNYRDAIRQNLGVLMDTAALSLCEENDLPILVFDVEAPNAITQAVRQGAAGTIVYSGPTRLA